MSDTGAPEVSDTVHLAEVLPDGTTREWLRSGTPYTATDEQRATVREAITAMHWQRRGQPMAMSPSLLVEEVITQMGLRIATQVGHSVHEIHHPDCDCPDPDHPDHWASYSLVGVKVRHRHAWWTLYLLDVGVGAVWLVSDVTEAPLPADVSVACGIDWHDRCAGTYRDSDHRSPCRCSCAHPPATAAAV